MIVEGGQGDEEPQINLEGLSRKEILKVLAEKTGISKNTLYDLLLKD